MQFLCLSHCDALLTGVNDKHGGGLAFHVGDTAHEFLELFNLKLQLRDLFFRKQVERAVLFHRFELLQTLNALLDGFEVCQHAAKPTGVDIGHTAAGSLLTDGILRLLLRADEKDFLPVRCELAHKHIGLFQLAHGFLQINDIDAVALGEDILRHFGVPPTGLMAEVDTRFQ